MVHAPAAEGVTSRVTEITRTIQRITRDRTRALLLLPL